MGFLSEFSNRTCALILVVMSTSFQCLAQQVSVDDARKVAAQFMQNRKDKFCTRSYQSSIVENNLQLVYSESDDNDNPALYVFTPIDGLGFVITSADKRFDDILAYSDDTPFLADNIPYATKSLLKRYKQQIAYVREKNITKYENITRSSDREPIPYMVKSKWGQKEPYNECCPTNTLTGKKMDTGCVATAMAQIINYHKHPSRGTGSHSYQWRGLTLTADFGNTDYHLEELKNIYSGVATTQYEKKLIGTLLYHCGVSVNMDYLLSGGAEADIEGKPFSDYFGYSDNYYWIMSEDYDEEDLISMVYDELLHGRPLLAGGDNGSDGHAYICDGYDTGNYLHYNLGWEGNSDGYYKFLNIGSLYTSMFLAGLKPCTDAVTIDGLRYEISDDEAFLVGLQADMAKVAIPERLTYNGKSLKVKTISQMAFRDNKTITSVSIPGSVVALPDSMFAGCTNLKEIIIQDSDDTITRNWDVFKGCSPEKLYLGRNFKESFGMESLQEVTIGAKVTSLPPYALAGSKIGNIHIPANLTRIDSTAFAFCYSMESYEVDGDNPVYCSVEGVLYDKQQTTLVRFPTRKSQSKFVLPPSVSRITCYAMLDFLADTLALSENLKKIGVEAIPNAWKVKVMYVPCITPPTCGENAFVDSFPQGVIYVPKGSLFRYRNASEWKKLNNIKEMNIGEMKSAISTRILHVQEDGGLSSYYNLKGQRIVTPSKGILIMNGKKIVVK